MATTGVHAGVSVTHTVVLFVPLVQEIVCK